MKRRRYTLPSSDLKECAKQLLKPYGFTEAEINACLGEPEADTARQMREWQEAQQEKKQAAIAASIRKEKKAK